MTYRNYRIAGMTLACAGLLVTMTLAQAAPPPKTELPDCKNIANDPCTEAQKGKQQECKQDNGAIACFVCTEGRNGGTYHWRRLNNGKCFDEITPGDDLTDFGIDF